jgi:hypothetical protein
MNASLGSGGVREIFGVLARGRVAEGEWRVGEWRGGWRVAGLRYPRAIVKLTARAWDVPVLLLATIVSL